MKNPNEVVEFTYSIAKKKCSYPLPKVLILSILAGAYLSMGATLSIMSGFGFEAISEGNYALNKIFMAATFPLGLILIIIMGADLFTGNTASLIPAAMTRRVSVKAVLRNWGLVWVGNFAGTLLFAYLFVHLTGVLDSEPMREGLESVAMAKCSNTFGVTFLKGVAANWFVCLAVWMAYSSDTIMGRIATLWLPIFAFVSLGYEHSIANMFFIPMAMFQGADISVSELFTSNLIPATLGNILGGALFVGCVHGYLFGNKTNK